MLPGDEAWGPGVEQRWPSHPANTPSLEPPLAARLDALLLQAVSHLEFGKVIAH